MTRGSAIVGMILSLLAGMGLMRGLLRSHEAGKVHETAPAGHAQAKVPVLSDDPSWGAADAPVTIVLFSDYQCPFCSRIEPTIAALKQKYGPSKLRVVWKNFPLPFHQKAMPAHVAAATVFQLGGSAAFWEFHELAFQNQQQLTEDNFAAWAAKAGVDQAKFKTAFAAQTAKAKVDKDLETGRQAGVRGTPASFINGIFVSGARPQSFFEAEIDKQLEAAKQLLAAGTPKSEVYVTLTNKNHQQQPAGPDKGKRPDRPDQDSKTVWKVPVAPDDPKKGNAEALVTIVEFSDFQCPFCARVEPTMKQIFDAYSDKVRLVWKDQPLPFHKRALPTANLAREAMAQKGSKGFWEAHALLFENQRKLEDEDLWGYAEKLGLDVAKVKAAVAGNSYQAAIEACQDLAGDLNASGTPHFFINGRRIVGAQPFEQFKTIIDEELAKGQAMLAKGIAAKDLYAEIIKDGKEPPPPEKKDAGPAPKDAPWKGAADAKVVIQEFSDFQCPFCSRAASTIEEVLKQYGTEVKLVWRHKPLPMHEDAPLAHQAALEAFAQKGNQGFWAMHDKLFAGQSSPGLKRAELEKYAKELELDLGKLKKALDAATHKARIDQDAAAAEKIGIGGTPAFVIGDYFLTGAQPPAKFKKLIDRALRDAGVPAGTVMRGP